MKQLDFPSLIVGLSQVVKDPTQSFLTEGGESIHVFIDRTPEQFEEVWRGGYDGYHIFTKGTGVSATYLLAFWLRHVSNKFRRPIGDYLGIVASRFPLEQWESGTGSLAHHKGGGAGKKIVDEIIGGLIVALGEDRVLHTPAKRFLSEHDRGLYNKLRVLFRPSSWQPLETQFTENQAEKGVYLIACLNRNLSRVRIRVGQARDEALAERLGDHITDLDSRMPDGFRAAFYSSAKLSESRITRAESALYHLVPPGIRLSGSTHLSGNCELCIAGID